MSTPAIPVKNVARRPVDLESGRVLAHGERCDDAPDTDHTRALIGAGLLVATEPLPDPPTLEQKTVPELREEAEARDIDVPSNAVKADLILLIETHDKEAGHAVA